ncbi:unnamed protein product [Amoebophrya sp. A25]|nr:unnamed protein product [Amoebophrya sp. A25]|eukprot:GSA25T00025708001.1
MKLLHKHKSAFLSFVSFLATTPALASFCDDEFAEHCLKITFPSDATNLDIGKQCYQDAIPADKRSSECEKWMQLHKACETEFAGERCKGSAFTPDAEVCVKQWTPAAELTDACKAVVGSGEEKETKEEELSPEAKRRRAARRRTREEAAKRARGEKEGDKKKKTSTKKKATKKKKAAKKDDL